MANTDYYQISNVNYSKADLLIKGKYFDYQIMTHDYSNNNKKHIFMSHGYLDNCAYSISVIKFFLSQGYDVTCFELPGHGESSGRRGDIDSFHTYGIIIKKLVGLKDLKKYEHNIFYAHSTGNSGMIDLLIKGEKLPFDKYIMASPLIQSYLYGLSSFAIGTLGRLLPYVPRKYRNKNNSDYRTILSQDPRPINWLPLNWARRHIDWNNRIKLSSLESDLELNLIFATNDTVINTEYNKNFLLERFPKSKVFMIQNSGHHYYFQKPEITESFFQTLHDIL